MTQVFDRNQIRRCSAELRKRLPELRTKHTPFVLMAVLAENIGGSLLVTQRDRRCTPEAARAVIERVREIAFAP